MRGQREARAAEVARPAAAQHGVVSFWQLLELGVGRDAIQYWVKTGRLHRIHRGVYAVGHRGLTVEGRYMAAVLACGPNAVLSYWAAAMHWELLQTRRVVIDVSVPSHRRAPRTITPHWVKLHPSDRTKRHNIPVTSVPRTLLDLAGVAPLRQLRRAVNEADRRGKLNRPAIEELLERNPRRKGTKAIRAVIAAVDPGTRRTRSDLEVEFLELLRRERLPMPVVNTKVEGYEVDMHWPCTTLIVELDGYEYHRTPASFDSDRRRDAELTTKGYTVIRISDRWLATDPRGVAETIRYLVTSGSIASSE